MIKTKFQRELEQELTRLEVNDYWWERSGHHFRLTFRVNGRTFQHPVTNARKPGGNANALADIRRVVRRAREGINFAGFAVRPHAGAST